MSRRSLLEEAAKAVLLAPLGVALIVRDSLPNLLTDGRAEIDRQVRSARMVGTFALTRIRKEAEARLHVFAQDPFPATATTPGSPPASTDVVSDSTAETASAARFDGASEPSGSVAPAEPSETKAASARRTATRKPAAARASATKSAAANPAVAVDAASSPNASASSDQVAALLLLPASQLIGKLAGLSADERMALEAAERAGRKRQTLLHKLEQLQA